MLSFFLSFSFCHHHIRHFRPYAFDRNDPTDTLNAKNFIYVEQLTDLGFPNSTRDDLIYSIQKFGIDKNTILPYFVSICAYASKNGTLILEQNSENKYRGSGFLMLKGEDQYLNFGQMMGDDMILEHGAEYVSKIYPWTSAAYVWKQNYMNDFVKMKDKKRVSVTKACKELLGYACEADTINQLFNLSSTVFDERLERNDYYDKYHYQDSFRSKYYYYY